MLRWRGNADADRMTMPSNNAENRKPMRPLMPLLLLSMIVFALPARSQDLRAITEDGRKVLLAPDGKWRFDTSPASAPSSTNPVSPYQSAVQRFSVSFSPGDWTLVPKRDGDQGNKRTFRHRSLPIYAMVIADELPATTPVLKNIILSNARSAGATTTVLVDQSQDLRGKEVGALRFAASMDGLDFVFSSHYYADSDGNIQVMCYTAQALFFKYKGDCQRFLDGLTIQ
jgi:hypothetical protein